MRKKPLYKLPSYQEVLYDLDTNKELTGDYLICDIKLIDIVLGLVKNGYEVVDCEVKDRDNIYLKKSGVKAQLGDKKTVKDIIKEGKRKNEYRRITHINKDYVKYDCFQADNKIKIRIKGKHDFPNPPKCCKVIHKGNYTVIEATIPQIEETDRMYGYKRKTKQLNDNYAIDQQLKPWLETVVGKKFDKVETPENSYGNSCFAVDLKKGSVIDGNYIAIDPLMVPIIGQLREKGYQTLGCCSGHYDCVFTQNTGITPNEKEVNKNAETWIVLKKDSAPQTPDVAEAEEYGDYYRIYISHKLTRDKKTGDVPIYKSVKQLRKEMGESILQLCQWSKELPSKTKEKPY